MYETKQELVDICHKLYEKDYLVATSGNVSVRTADGFLISPHQIRKDSVQSEQIVECRLDGTPLTTDTLPSCEIPMHKMVYENRKDISAAIHAHPIFCITCTLLKISLSETSLPEATVHIGNSPTVPYVKPGSEEQAKAILPYLSNNCLLLEKHGVLVLGRNLNDAFNRLEQLEYVAKIAYLAKIKMRD